MKYKKISRRTAIKLGMGVIGATALGLWGRNEILAFFRADKARMLLSGNTGEELVDRRNYNGGITLPLLGFGAMRLPIKDGNIDEELAEEMLDYAYRHGVNYFDTAYIYHGGKSETFLGNVLKKYPRSSYYLADKMPGYKLSGPAEAKKVFQEQLDRCQTKYFDNYFLHYLNDEASFRKFYIEGGVLDYLQEEKLQGRIRNLGFSFHGDVPFLKKLVEGWAWDCALIQLNYMDWNEEKNEPEGSRDKGSQYRLLAEHHVPIIVMEPLKGGRLANLPKQAGAILETQEPDRSQASWAIRFVASQPQVVSILSGMSTLEQVVDNIDTLTGFEALDETKLSALHEARERTSSSQTVGCTSCRYCMPCPYGIDIEGNFRVYNDWAGELGLLNQTKTAPLEMKQSFLLHYNNAIAKKGRADMCIRCGKCLPFCPQHIQIPVELGKVESLVELCYSALKNGQGYQKRSEL